MKKRDIALKVLEQSVGLPYRWGGDDPVGGFDCSGLMVEVLKATGIFGEKGDATAQGLSKLYPETDILQVGVMVYWDWNNDGVIDHVEMVAHVDEEGDVYTIGASGGGSATTTTLAAESSNAYIKVRPLRKGYVLANDPFEKE